MSGHNVTPPPVDDCVYCPLIRATRADEDRQNERALADAILMSREAATQQAFREAVEIIYSAPLQRLRDEDGTEYVARDPLTAEVRGHAMRRLKAIRGIGLA
jgi:hypothetical protein